MESSSDMDDDSIIRGRRSSSKPLYFSACLASPCSIVPHHHHHSSEYSRIRRQLHEEGEDRCRWGSRSRHLWRRIVRKLLKESKSLYGSTTTTTKKKQLTFRYDAVSYKQNFDDGSHRRSEEDRRRYVADSSTMFG